jgi:uncharacterized peroxidase-related enzyme
LARAACKLSVVATSHFNRRNYFALVHARFASHFSPRSADLQRLLDEGTGAALDPRWDAIVAASVALFSTLIAFGAANVDALRAVSLDHLAISDLIHDVAFINSAHRLMLSFSEPQAPNGAAS